MKTDKFQNKYRIPSARAVWYDYNGGDYFITICTAERLHYFGEINNGEMGFNVLGQKLNQLIGDIITHHPYCEIPLFQIMPNHVHLIVCIDGKCRDATCHVSTTERTNEIQETQDATLTTENCLCDARDATCHVSMVDHEKMRSIAEQCGLLSIAMGGLKSALTKYANLNKIKFGWQTRFHDHIIRSQEEMNMIAAYIENNVLTWEKDKFYSK